MNLVFNIARTYEYEFTSNNLIKSDMVIDRVAMKGSGDVTGVCLVLDRVNNMQERRQSPLGFSLTDKSGATIALSMPITVCIHFHTINES